VSVQEDAPTASADGEVADLFEEGGEMGDLMRAIDWSRTPVGPTSTWSQAFRTMVGLLLRNRFPLLLWWGPEFVQFYNDAYRPIPAAKHPSSMGQPAAACWTEIWHIIGPMIEAPFRGAPATWSDDLELIINRKGFLEEGHFKVAYSPVPDDTAPRGIGGVLATVAETTETVYAERQLRTLRELGARATKAETPDGACEIAAAVQRENARDVPFALFYLLDEQGRTTRLAASAGLAGDFGALAPLTLTADTPSGWELDGVIQDRRIEVITDLPARFARLPTGAWKQPPSSAIALPLGTPAEPHLYGVLIAGVSPHRALDAGYRGFIELAASQIVTAIQNARAHQEERRRAEALAALDRAKTEFFGNVSHEFRTPLTLMLGPTEEALASGCALTGEDLDVVHRNQLRLLKLVNNLLDFARAEANRAQASYQPTDVAGLTADIASSFRSAIERAGLELRVDCRPAAAPVCVDRQMWETIVLNLLSNGLKFTLAGSITVTVEPQGNELALIVADTGVGIAESELPHVFERFHRVGGGRGRTHEGSGIGLALVHELVRLHGGRVSVASTPGQGTRFTVSIPTGSEHLPADRIRSAAPLGSTAGAASYVAEAQLWLPEGASQTFGAGEAPADGQDTASGHILLVDDNADMRDYVRRLLARRWIVETAPDGEAALAAARARPPALVVTDVMMPNLDGFGLLRCLRQDEGLKSVPVIVLSARAGEEARVDGLAEGADDYLVKPFSARELVARVETQLKLRGLRAASDEQARIAESARRHAEEAARAKDEFMAMLGHELRNPLAPILTALQLMELRGSDIFPKERATIDRQVRHLVRLVDDLLEVSRIARGRISFAKRPVDVGEVVAQAVELASPLFEERRHHLTLDVASPLVVEGDSIRLAQTFANLLTNAAKYTPVGGSIAVTGRRVGAWVEVTVTDSGIGIRPEMLPRIFDLFVQESQTPERSHGGLGLGLSIVKSLVMLHGGTVAARSDGPGRGSEFVVSLPASPAEAQIWPSTEIIDLATGRDRAARRRVLIVDDNEDAASSLADALQELGHAVRTAHDGPTALAALETFSPDVAFLDIGLPVMDGYELARRIRVEPRHAGIRLVSVTGYGQPSDRARAKEAGFAIHLVKPVDLTIVERIIVGDPN
jgi:signal transduction histidine kinase